jgi:hypothetical protein
LTSLPFKSEQLATHITDLQTKLRIEQTEQGRIALVGCETDKPTSSGTATEITSLAQLVAKSTVFAIDIKVDFVAV